MHRVRSRFAFWLATVCLIVPAAYGQEATEPETEAVAEAPATVEETDMERAQRKLSELTEATRLIDELLDSAKGVIGEERDLMRIQAVSFVEDLDELSTDLVKLIPKLEGEPAAIESLRNATGDLLRYHADLYLGGNKRIGRELADLRRERANIPVEGLAEFEDRISATRDRYDYNSAGAAAVATHVEAIGLEASGMWKPIMEMLGEHAEDLATRLQLTVGERNRLEERINSAQRIGATERLPDQALRVQALQHRVDGILESLDRTADLLEERGVETAPYRQAMIRATGEMTEEILDTRVLLGLAKDLLNSSTRWLRDNGPRMLFRLGVLLLFTVLFRVGARLSWFLLRMIVRPSRLLGSLISRMLGPVSLVVGLMVGFWFLGVNPATLLAGVGVASLVVGLALQDTLGNIAAGFFILAYRPYDEEDVVSAGGVIGCVKAMGLANTTIVTFDNRRLFVPNRKIWSEVIENRSAEATRRVDTIVRIGYAENVDSALQAIREIVDKHELVLEKPEPTIFVSELADSWVEIAVRPWVRAENWWPMTMDLPRTLRIGLGKRGIEIPLPRQELDLKSGGDG